MQSLDLDVLERVLEWRRAGRRAWLLTVAQTFGASPRPPGSLAAIRDDGILVGSVSGGCIEDDLVARREEYSGRKPAFAAYGVTAEEARRFGLPCGGELEVIIEPEVEPRHLEELLEAISSGRIVARHVDLASGAWSFSPASPVDEVARADSRFTSIHGPRWRMLIIGGSEIAHYLAEIASTVDFRCSCAIRARNTAGVAREGRPLGRGHARRRGRRLQARCAQRDPHGLARSQARRHGAHRSAEERCVLCGRGGLVAYERGAAQAPGRIRAHAAAGRAASRSRGAFDRLAHATRDRGIDPADLIAARNSIVLEKSQENARRKSS
jgi:xanthine/CO dehydrogenase XdhC/CoxF family maturation factor